MSAGWLMKHDKDAPSLQPSMRCSRGVQLTRGSSELSQATTRPVLGILSHSSHLLLSLKPTCSFHLCLSAPGSLQPPQSSLRLWFCFPAATRLMRTLPTSLQTSVPLVFWCLTASPKTKNLWELFQPKNNYFCCHWYLFEIKLPLSFLLHLLSFWENSSKRDCCFYGHFSPNEATGSMCQDVF